MDNIGYIVAGYALTFVAIVGYALALGRRLKEERRELERVGGL